MNTFLLLVYYVLIWFTVECVEGQGKMPPPVGLTSMKKCGEYYGLKLEDTEKSFSPPTKEELDAIHKEELKYPPISSTVRQYGLLKPPRFMTQKRRSYLSNERLLIGGVNALANQLPFMTKEELDAIHKEELKYPPVSYGGAINKAPIGYVAGGQNALVKQLPFMAALVYDDGGRKQYACGGTLISEQFVVTAAHCILSPDWGKVTYVRLGDLNVTNTFDDEGAQEYQIEDFCIHPEYNYPVQYNDIALIKLDRPVVFTGFVFPACLEPKRVELRSQNFSIAGWGRLGYNKEQSDYLQVGFISHYPGLECQKNFRRTSSLPEGVKPESQICAGSYTSVIDTCKGDSGGPLAYKRSTSPNFFVDMLAGITAFGPACGVEPNIPAIYTRVSYYTDWIERNVWPNEFGGSATPVCKNRSTYAYSAFNPYVFNPYSAFNPYVFNPYSAFNPYIFNPYVLNPYAQYFPDSSFGSFSYFK